MKGSRQLLIGLGILAGMAGGVAAAALLIATLVAPPSGDPTPTPQPTFDVGVAPRAVGGRLEVDGDRTGALVLDEARGGAARYEVLEDGGVSVTPAQDTFLQGPDGRVRFQRGTGIITLIDYDGLSFYPEPDDCSVTLGALNEDIGLMAALVECPELAAIRDGGTVSMTGVVAMPADVLRGRGDIPRSGGSVEVGGSRVTFTEAEIFLDERTSPEHERIGWGISTRDFMSSLSIEYDVDADQFYLSAIQVDEEYVEMEEPCPIEAEELGRINDVTTAVRLTIDCGGVDVPGGGTGSVTGTIVADVIEGFIEGGSDAP